LSTSYFKIRVIFNLKKKRKMCVIWNLAWSFSGDSESLNSVLTCCVSLNYFQNIKSINLGHFLTVLCSF